MATTGAPTHVRSAGRSGRHAGPAPGDGSTSMTERPGESRGHRFRPPSLGTPALYAMGTLPARAPKRPCRRIGKGAAQDHALCRYLDLVPVGRSSQGAATAGVAGKDHRQQPRSRPFGRPLASPVCGLPGRGLAPARALTHCGARPNFPKCCRLQPLAGVCIFAVMPRLSEWEPVTASSLEARGSQTAKQ